MYKRQIVVCLILPSTASLVGMLMLGNLFRESGVVKQLAETASNALMYIVVILLGTSCLLYTSGKKAQCKNGGSVKLYRPSGNKSEGSCKAYGAFIYQQRGKG